jgi:hypothetical protein
MSRGGGGTVPAILVADGIAQLGLWGLCVTIASGIASILAIDYSALLILGIIFLVLGVFLLVFVGEHGGI